MGDDNSHVLDALYEGLERDPSSVFLHERMIEVWSASGQHGAIISSFLHF